MNEGPEVKEDGHEVGYREFKKLVMQSHCGSWHDVKDIKTAILQKLPEWNERSDLKGWVRAEEAASPETMNELARLSSENRTLREQLATKSDTFDGLHFEEIVKLLCEDTDLGKIDELMTVIHDAPKNVGHLFDLLMDTLAVEPSQFIDKGYFKHLDSIPQIQLLKKHNLIKTDIAREDEIRASHITTKNIPPRLYLTDVGRRLRNRLLIYGDKEKRYHELWRVSDSETPSSEG